MTRSQPRGPQRGIVYLEMLMAMVPLLVAFLGICQLSLFLVAKLVVQHAATRAARAAMVILEDDPAAFDDAPRGSLVEGTREDGGDTLPIDTGDVDLSAFSTSLGAVPPSLSPNAGDASQRQREDRTPSGARMQAIRAAAYHPLAILGPPPAQLLERPTLGGELGSKRKLGADAYSRLLGGRLLYVKGAAAVSLHEPGQDALLTRVEPRAPFTVRVAFLFPCGVPLVASLMCSGRSGRWLTLLGLGSDEAERLEQATAHAESGIVRDLVLATIPHLALFEAEATMPNHGAHYYPRDE